MRWQQLHSPKSGIPTHEQWSQHPKEENFEPIFHECHILKNYHLQAQSPAAPDHSIPFPQHVDQASQSV